MPTAYSIDLRKRVVAARLSGQTLTAVAARFSVSVAWVKMMVKQHQQTGDLSPKPFIPRRKLKLLPYLDTLRKLVAEQPDATLPELMSRLPIRVSQTALWNTLNKLGYTFKKSPARRRAVASRRSRAASGMA
jgi:transposase